MPVLKCKMCGGTLQLHSDGSMYKCEYCGTLQMAPRCNSGVDNDSEDALVLRGNMALDDGDYSKAIVFFERALDSNPKNGWAYLGIFLGNNKIPSLSALENRIVDYSNDKHFQRSMQFADAKLEKILEAAIDANERNIIKQKQHIMRRFIVALKEMVSKKELEEERERKRNEELKRSRERAAAEKAYREACDLVEKKISQEASPLIEGIERSYEPAISDIRARGGQAQADCMRRKIALQMQLSTIKKQEKTLGFSAKDEKEQLRQQEAEVQTQLDIVTQREEQIAQTMKEQIHEVEVLRDAEISAALQEIRSRYSLPKR